METIYVVLATDENYAQHVGVTLLSFNYLERK
jgi:lipopolysaccharide biosynthesis glycosyltransferase